MATIHTPSPKSPENDKSKRYDRQLRLWGENGQQALETSHVCLINANVVGTEVLKNLVLPGIRAFTIIDDHFVTKDDMDSNFFLCYGDNLGKSRAKIAAQNLLELNNDVKKGDYLHENLEALLDKDANFFTNFTLVIAANINDERTLNRLSREMWNLNIPLLVVKSIGFLGYIRLQVQEHPILEPHPDNTMEDLRLDDPFPELKVCLDSYPPFQDMSRKELSKIPALVIMYRHLQKWQLANRKQSNDIPSNYREKSDLVKMIKEDMFNLKESKTFKSDESSARFGLELDNFEEAYKLVNKIFTVSPKIPNNLELLLDEANTIDFSTKKINSNFWIMMKALKEFTKRYDCLPLKGTIPDMNSGSEHYIGLQKIYQTRAKDDVERLAKIIIEGPKGLNVPESELKLLCKNVRYLTLIRTSPMYQEMTGKSIRNLATSRLQNGTDEEGSDSDDLRFYILMRLVDRFYSKHQRLPGQSDEEVDVLELKREFKDFCSDLGCNVAIKDDLIHEICRYGGCEIHTVSAFLGGCAAQEAIKIMTGQYIPIDNTFVYNGLTSTTSTYKL